MDPYSIMGVSKSFDVQTLRANYRRMASQLMSGSIGDLGREQADEALATIAWAYKYLLRVHADRQQQPSEPSSLSYPRSAQRHSSPLGGGSAATTAAAAVGGGTYYNDDVEGEDASAPTAAGACRDPEAARRARASKYDMAKFNEVFESTRPRAVYDKGYDDWLKRASFDPEEDERQLQQQMQQQQLAEPEPVQFTRSSKGLGGMGYAELGVNDISDFGQRGDLGGRGGMQFSDIRVAHSSSKLIDPTRVQMPEEQHATLESLQAARSDESSVRLTPEQHAALEAARRRKAEADALRMAHLSEEDRSLSDHHQAVQRAIFGEAVPISMLVPERHLPQKKSGGGRRGGGGGSMGHEDTGADVEDASIATSYASAAAAAAAAGGSGAGTAPALPLPPVRAPPPSCSRRVLPTAFPEFPSSMATRR